MCPVFSSGCYLACLGLGLAWLIIGSLLLWQAWNRVVCHVFSQRPMIKFWQALLTLVCVVVLALPCVMRKRMYSHHGMHGAGMKGSCCDKPNCDEKNKGTADGSGKDCCEKPDCCKDKEAKKK